MVTNSKEWGKQITTTGYFPDSVRVALCGSESLQPVMTFSPMTSAGIAATTINVEFSRQLL
jgi:hypothetical protein